MRVLILVMSVVLLGGCAIHDLSKTGNVIQYRPVVQDNAQTKSCPKCMRTFPLSERICPYDGAQLEQL